MTEQRDTLDRLWFELQAIGVLMVYDEQPYELREIMARAMFKAASRLGFTDVECAKLFRVFFTNKEAAKVRSPEFKLR